MKKIIFIIVFFITQYTFSLTTHHRYFCTPSASETYTIADIDLRNIYDNGTYTWYATNDSTTTPLASTEVIFANTTYYYISNNGNAHSFTIHIEDTLPAPIIEYNYSGGCEDDYDISDINTELSYYGGVNDLIYWFDNSNGYGTPFEEYAQLPSHTTLYGFLSLGDCAVAPVEFLYELIDHGPPNYNGIGNHTQYFLSADNPTVSDIIADNNTTNWNPPVYWFSPYAEYALYYNTPLQNNGYYHASSYEYIGTPTCFYFYSEPFITKLDHNSIKGTIKFDANNNGCGYPDAYVPNVTVTSTNGTSTFTTFSRNGNYTQHIYGSLGNFDTTIDVPYYFDVNPNPLVTTFNQYNSNSNMNSFTGNFCLTANQSAEDVSIDILTRPIRPGFDTSCILIYKNIGTQQANGEITFNFDDSKLSFLNTDGTIVSQTANNITFSYSGLDPFETNYIAIHFNAFQPPTTNIDDVVSFNASITPLTNDETPSDNSFSINRTVIDSFDPNDITCVEGNSIEQDNIDDYLHYVIRFENTGSAEAINIKVENQLDTKLDWSSFKVISSSHENRVAIKDGAVSFIFSHVDLPYTAPQSQGYIYYKIKPKADVIIGDVFENQAHIFFDFNNAIHTNISSTEVVTILGTAEDTLLNFSIAPVPTASTLTVKSNEQIKSITIFSYLGKRIQHITNSRTIDISNLEKGIYFCKIIDVNGKTGTKKVIKE